MSDKRAELEQVYAQADCLYTLAEVEQALDRMADQINRDFADKYPLVLGVMNGALSTLGYLLQRLPFLLEVDYLHATRYTGQLEGSDVMWKRYPEVSMEGRHILLVDDILDRGITLAAIVQHCKAAGAVDVRIAVLTEKLLANHTPAIAADYVALQVPDRYVFGYGMDYEDHWRNAPGIFACK